MPDMEQLRQDILSEDGDGTPSGNTSQLSPEVAAAMEANARVRGWRPKEEFTGPEDRWVDAQTFLKRGEEFTSNLKKEVQELKQKIADGEVTKKQYTKFMQDTLDKKDREISDLRRQLKREIRTAVREGDDDLADELESRDNELAQQQRQVASERDKLKEPTEITPEQTSPNMNDLVLQEWIEDGNEWFAKDEKLQQYAMGLGSQMIKEGFKERGRPFLDALRKEMEKQFPRKFGQKRDTAPAHAGGTSRGGVAGTEGATSGLGRSAKDLPEEDRKIMNNLVSNGYTTEEAFLKSYFSR